MSRIPSVRLRVLALRVVLVTCCTACTSAGRPTGQDSDVCGAAPRPTLEWFDSVSDPTAGSVLVSHGLNNQPEMMTALIDQLTAAGLDVLLVALPEECGERSFPAARIEERWLEAIGAGFEELYSRPSEVRYAVGYSLGAVLTLAWLDACAACGVEAMALIAPPLDLKGSAKLIRLLTPFRHLGMYLPSLAPKRYRRRSRVSLASYRALLNATATTRTLARREFFAEVPTVIFVSRKDELVSYRGVVDWVERQGLEAWSVQPVEARPETERSYHHLLVLPEHAGAAPWKAMVDRIRALLAVPPEGSGEQ